MDSVGFGVLAIGMFGDGMLGFLSANGISIPRDASTTVQTLFSLFAAAMFVLGAINTDVDTTQKHRSHGLRLLLILSISAFAVIILAMESTKLWARIAPLMPTPGPISRFMSDQFLAIFLVRALAFLGFGVALVVNIASHLERRDSISYGISGCLLFMISAQAMLLVSTTRNDLEWWMSHVLTLAGLLVFLFRLGGEFVISYVSAKERIEELEALHAVTSQLNQTLDLRVVLLAFMTDTARMLFAKFASVMLADQDGQTLCTFCSYGLPDSPLSLGCPQEVNGSGRPGFYCGHTARAFREKQVCVVEDVYTDVEFIPWKILARYDGTAISVPLVYHGVPLGVLNLFFEKNIVINEEKIKLFQTLGSSAAVAIANAQMYDRSIQIEAENHRLRPAS
jgi:hypothetical protein